MTEAQKAHGRIETTEEVKRLAGVCVAEEKPAAGIKGILGKIKDQLSKCLRSLIGQAKNAKPDVSCALDAGKDKDVVEGDSSLEHFTDDDMTRSDFPTVTHIRLDASNSEQLTGRSSLRGDLPIVMDDPGDAKGQLDGLRKSGNYGEIASIRTDNGSSRMLRHMARAILDEDVDIINGIFALRVIAMYGNDKNTRIKAVNKLRTIGEQDENTKGRVRMELKNIIEGEGPDQYRDEDITKLAQEAFQALSNI